MSGARSGFLLAIVCTLGLLAGCDNRYEALTAAPPGMTATLNDHDKAIVLSQGVSLAFECFGDSSSKPCGRDISTADAARALVFPADVDTLTEGGGLGGPSDRSVFVVVGIAPGHTEVHAGGGTLGVTVLAPEP